MDIPESLSNWTSLDLMNTILSLLPSDSTLISEILSVPYKECPELLLLSLFQSDHQHDIIKSIILQHLFPLLLSTNLNLRLALMIKQIWNENKDIISTLFINICKKQPDIIADILTISIGIPELTQILLHVCALIIHFITLVGPLTVCSFECRNG